MKKIIVSLLLAVSMILSMAVPAFAADEFAPIESTFQLQLLPIGTASGSVIKVEKGDVVPVNLYLSCMDGNTELDEFGFYEFYDVITFRDSRFSLVEDSIETADGFYCEIINDGKIRVYADTLTGLEGGVILSFELKAETTGYAYLSQSAAVYRNSSREYDVYCDGPDIQSVSSINEDGEYFINTEYDPDCGSVVLPEEFASAGDQVIFYVLKEKDFEIADVTVRYKKNGVNKLVLCKSATNSTGARFYYFTMPEADVTINVDFEGDDGYESGMNDIFLEYTKEKGFVYLNKYSASEGESVRIYVEPNISSYEYKIVASYKDGSTYSDIDIKKSVTGGYSYFTMPDGEVYIEVVIAGTATSGATRYDIYDGTDDDRGYVNMPIDATKDQKVKISAVPNYGYIVDEIVVYGVDSDDIYDVTEASNYYYFYMPAEEVVVEVIFVDEYEEGEQYEIDTEDIDEEGGSVRLSATKAEYKKLVKIWVTPDDDFELADLEIIKKKTGDTVKVYGDEDDAYYYFYMPRDDVYIYLAFDEVKSSSTKYKVTLSFDDDMGNVYTSKTTYAKNKTVKIYAEPKAGYVVDNVKVTKATSSSTKVAVYDDEDVDGETYYYFNMPAYNVKVTVTFEKKAGNVGDYKVTLDSKVQNGSIKATNSKADVGERVQITATPNKGYEVDEITVKKSNGTKVAVTKNTDGTYIFTMPSANVTVSATFKKEEEKPTTPTTPTTPTPGVHVCAAKPFTDVDTSKWYHEAIDYAISNGLMKGTSATTFAPDMIASRGMIVTILWRIAGNPLSNANMPFTDVPDAEWYTEAIRWAAANGLLQDVAVSGAFEPNSALTREQIAAIIYRYEQYKGGGFKGIINADLSKFKDMNEISYWAVEAISWCNANGVLKGDDTTSKLMPKGNVDRAQLAQILMNYAELAEADEK